MIVLKFGGTSVQDSAAMDRALDITFERLERSPVLISSAMAKITDSLIAAADAAVAGDGEAVASLLDAVKERHIKCAYEFLKGQNLNYAVTRINEIMTELRSILRGCVYLKECTPQSCDAVVSCGELLSTVLLHARARERKIDAVWLDSRELIKTDSIYGEAAVDFKATETAIRKAVTPAAGKLFIAQGFIGSDANSLTTTLGRGGSDYTAAVFGSILNAEEIQIWTDVNGIMTTDPRLVPEAKTVNEISYEEAAELAFFGAKVVHPATIQPAVAKKIPVTVLNTRDPEGIFTRISENSIENVIRLSGLGIQDWTALKEFTADKGRPYLHLYVELTPDAALHSAVSREILKEHLTIYFKYVDQDYHDLKRILGMDPLEITIVKCGTFENYRKYRGKTLRRINPDVHDVREMVKMQEELYAQRRH